MFQKWLSGFYRKNKGKLELLAKVIFATLIAIFVFYLVVKNGMESGNASIDESQTIYKPQETVVSGSNVKEYEYEEDSNIVKEFVEYCNTGKVNEAYNLLTEECKQNLYPTLEDFKQKYCNRYFLREKEYSLQSWANNGKYTTYQMRITDNMLSSGKYDNGGVYQDYITIVSSGEYKRININGYICRKEINKNSNIEGIDINVVKADVYMDYEEYTIKVTNNTENVIMLDSMKNPTYTLRLVSNDNNYSVRTNSISYTELMVNPEEEREMKIQFNKKYTSDSGVKNILFSQVVRNYNEFIQNQTEYNDFTTVKVELE